nr:translation initiation factor IF-2-like [Marmota flaviventris]
MAPPGGVCGHTALGRGSRPAEKSRAWETRRFRLAFLSESAPRRPIAPFPERPRGFLSGEGHGAGRARPRGAARRAPGRRAPAQLGTPRTVAGEPDPARPTPASPTGSIPHAPRDPRAAGHRRRRAPGLLAGAAAAGTPPPPAAPAPGSPPAPHSPPAPPRSREL